MILSLTEQIRTLSEREKKTIVENRVANSSYVHLDQLQLVQLGGSNGSRRDQQ
jgi:hypothetical protein